MKTRLFLLIAVLLFAQNVFAQETGQYDEKTDFFRFYNSELFQWDYSTFDGPQLNFQNQSSGTSFGINSLMRDTLLKYPDSAQYYDSYRKKTIAGNVLSYGGLAAFLGGFISLELFYLQRIGSDSMSQSDINAGLTSVGFLLGGLVSTLIGEFVLSSGQKSLFTSVNLYNRNRLREFSR